jgi:hypothetical protein
MEETTMKLFGWVSTGVLCLLLGASTGVFAQDKPDDPKPPKQEDAKPEAKPRQGDEDRPKDVKPEKRDDEKRDDMKQEAARPQDHDNARADNGRPAGKRVDRIPDDKFRANFGRQHVTVINQPVIVEGRPSFQFGGYWFGISTAWPVGWAYTDQVYVDYIDGEYFLFDVLHPGVRVALIVTM